MNRYLKRSSPGIRRGFTLVELLVAVAVFALLMVLLLTVVSQATRIWQQSDNQKIRRQTARLLLEIMVRDLESALFPLDRTNSRSLQFVLNPSIAPRNRDAAFWQAAVPSDGAHGDMYEVGYFVQWITDTNNRPHSALCRYDVSATNSNAIFHDPAAEWLTMDKLADYSPGLADTVSYKGVLAENVIGLWITLRDKDGSTNGFGPFYDSRAATNRPASAEIAFVLLDANAAKRLVSAVALTNNFMSSPEEYVAALPPEIKSGTQIFRATARFEAAP